MHQPRSPLVRALLWGVSGLVLAGMAVVAFWPAPVDRPLYGTLLRSMRTLQGYGLPEWVDYAAIESLANVLLFIPLGILASVLLPGRLWWMAFLLCAGLSAGIELVQDMVLPERHGTVQDVLLNSSGALLGVALAAAGRLARRYWRRHRSQRRTATVENGRHVTFTERNSTGKSSE